MRTLTIEDAAATQRSCQILSIWEQGWQKTDGRLSEPDFVIVVQDPEERASRYEHLRNDDVLAALELSYPTGFDTLPQDLTQTELDARFVQRLAFEHAGALVGLVTTLGFALIYGLSALE